MKDRIYTDSVEMHDAIAKDYAKNMRTEESHLFAHKISGILPIKSGDIILDVGAGNGRIAKAILEDYPQIMKYYALEPGKLGDFFMVEDHRLTLLRSLGQDIPLPDNTCNVSFASEVFCHLKRKEDQIAILREMQRVTKHGGFVCIISTICLDKTRSLYYRILRRPKEIYFKPKSKPDNGKEVYLYHRIYEIGEMKELLRKSNLKLVRMIQRPDKKFGIIKSVYDHVIAQKI